MCLVVFSNSVTQQIMRVYKVLIKSGDKYYSPFQYKPYSIGETYCTNRDNAPHIHNFKEPFSTITNEGIHAYTNLYAAQVFKGAYYRTSLNECVVTEWEIPKDTVCWTSRDKREIAATKMVFVKEINCS